MDSPVSRPFGPQAPAPDAPPAGSSAGARLRRYFLTGVIIAGPLAITASLTWWFVSLVDNWVKPVIPSIYLPENYLPFAIPGFGLLVALVSLTMLGFLTANLVGRTVVEAGDSLLERTPVVSGLYKGVKQVFTTVFSQSSTSFKRVGLVEYPTEGMWSVVFIGQEAPSNLNAALPAGEEQIGVFLPCSPNPTTGFFFYLPRSQVREIDMSVEDAAKLVMSAGLIQPDILKTKPVVVSSPPATA
jgi:uncharacterized membrane protein